MDLGQSVYIPFLNKTKQNKAKTANKQATTTKTFEAQFFFHPLDFPSFHSPNYHDFFC